MKLVHSDTIAVKPIRQENVLGSEDMSSPVSGRGTVELVGDSVRNISTGDTVYYNSVAGSHIKDLDLVVVQIDNIYLIGDAE